MASFFNLPYKSAQRTFRAKSETAVQGSKQYQLRKYAEQILGTGNLKTVVKLPEGEDQNEWLAHFAVDFYNHINMLYGMVAEFCTKEDCNVMTAGPTVEYLWQDNENYKRPTALPAPEYIQHLLAWAQRIIEDPNIFPSKAGVEFPRNFNIIVRNLARRFFRVYAHIYLSHFAVVIALGQEAHLNTSFKHFIYWVREFDLIDAKEMDPLAELTNLMDAE